MVGPFFAPIVLPRLFLHFFDLHFLEERGVVMYGERAREEIRRATRYALLAADEVFVPASSYFESASCRTILDEHSIFAEAGHLIALGGGSNLYEFAERKIGQYPSGSIQYEAYRTLLDNPDPALPFRSRQRSSTEDITTAWLRVLRRRDPIRTVFQEFGSHISVRQFERNWASVPDRLEDQAFIVPHIVPLLALNQDNRLLISRLHQVINPGYFASYTIELEAGVISRMAYLASADPIPSFGPDLAYGPLLQALRDQGLADRVDEIPATQLLTIRQDPRWIFSMRCALDAITEAEIREYHLKIPWMKAKEARRRGSLISMTIFHNISNSKIINDSFVQSSFNELEQSDPELAQALVGLARIVHESGNKEAGEVFDQFAEELTREPPRKAVLKSGWKALVGLLPHLDKAANIAQKMQKLF